MCALSKFVIYHWVWEQLWHGRCVCVNEEQDRKRHPSDIYPSSCLSGCLWHCEMEKKASSKMRCKHVDSMNSCFAMQLFKRWMYIFLSAFTMYVIRLAETHFSSPHFLSHAAFLPPPPFFFFLYSDLLGFIPGRRQQHLSGTHSVVGKNYKCFL